MKSISLILLFVAFVDVSFGLYSAKSDVIQLTSSNFKGKVLESDHIWLVEFFAPWCGHCKSLAPEYEKAAKALKGLVKVGAVDCDSDAGKSLAGEYGIRGFPTIKIFNANTQGKSQDFNGARTAQGLVDEVLKVAKSRTLSNLGGGGGKEDKKGGKDDVVELTDSNFDKLVLDGAEDWLVEFYAPWCGHCKNLAPEWAKAAKELSGKMKLGALDATIHQGKAQEYGVQGYPTIKYFPRKSSSSAKKQAEEYTGGRTAQDIIQWGLDKTSENIEPPKIVELTSAATFEATCESSLCIVAFLPQLLDCQTTCRNSYIEVLKDLGAEYKKKQWGWLWVEALSQPDLETALDVGGFGYPALAVVNVKKMKYSLLKGAFSKAGIGEFLRDLSYGRSGGSTGTIRGGQVPRIEERSKWDGKDAEMVQEEDVDLSDVDLDEKDEL